MGKESWICRFLRRIGLLKTYELSREQKAEMCRMAVQDGVCPRACSRCVWGERKDDV